MQALVPTRVPANGCPHRPPCTGCPRFGVPGVATHARAALEDLARAHGLPPVEVISGSTAGFRLRARLAIRGRLGSPKLGLFATGTHRVVHIPHCSVQHPLINRVAGVVRRALVDARVTAYSERAHLGVARYLQVVVERRSQKAQVVLVANAATPEPLTACFELIRERLGDQLHSLWFNSQQDRSNTILGPCFHRWSGPASVIESFGGADVHYPPGAFGQSNLEIAELIIEHIRRDVPMGATVAEFYAGVGAIGLSVIDRAGELRLNELSPHSLAGLDLGLAQLGPERRDRVTVVSGAAGAACRSMLGADVVIADPPRKGLDPELTDLLRDSPPGRFVYVSCGIAALLRDTLKLTAGGALRLTALTAFNLLPFTDHVETIARFDRAAREA